MTCRPRRRIFYNATTAALFIAAALLIGTVELLRLLISLFSFKGRTSWTG